LKEKKDSLAYQYVEKNRSPADIAERKKFLEIED
jgi:hypothetical protein